MRPIWIGLDTDEKGRICMAELTGDRPWTQTKTVRYLDLQQFQDAWEESFNDCKFDFAVALDYFEFVRGPSELVAWLTARRDIVLDYFNFPGLYPYFEDEVREMPGTFHKAYQQTARNLMLEVYSLQRRLQRLEEGLNRMAYTTPPHRCDPNGIYCPF